MLIKLINFKMRSPKNKKLTIVQNKFNQFKS